MRSASRPSTIRQAEAALAALILAALAFAGCVSGGTDSVAGGREVLFTNETGGIAGVVLSDGLLPVAGAVIGIADDDAGGASTDAAGGFRIGRLDPGSYTLSVTHPGFHNHTRDVEVEAGKVSEVRVTLTPRPSVEPYVRLDQDTGFIGCTLTWRDPVISPEGRAKAAMCTIVAQVGGVSSVDQSQIDYPSEPFEGIMDILGETTWTSTQALGTGLFVNYWLYHPEIHLTINDAWDVNWTAGGSPLQVHIPVERLHDVVSDNQADCARVCNLFALVYSYPQTAPSSPMDAGLAVDQRFEIFRSTFFNARMPADYTALPDV